MVEWLREVSGSTKNEWNSLEQHFNECFILIQVGMPADFINKLSRMFQDIKVSEDLNNQFKDQQKDRDTKTGDSVSCFWWEWKSNWGAPSAKCNVSSAVQVWCLKSSLQVSIKILNVGAWARTSERVPVTLPRELEDFIPEVRPAIILLRQWHIWTLCPTVDVFDAQVEEFYKTKHSGRKLQWHHHMSNGTVTFANKFVSSAELLPAWSLIFSHRTGKYDLEVTTFQMAVLFCWENRYYHNFEKCGQDQLLS